VNIDIKYALAEVNLTISHNPNPKCNPNLIPNPKISNNLNFPQTP